jgi:enoyl-CoA hydratase/carnithine racemase
VSDLLLERRDGMILRLTLNRPRQRNALSLDLIAELKAAVDAAALDGLTRVVVIAGAVPAFSAGHDLAEIRSHFADADGGEAFNRTLFSSCSALMLTLRESPLMVVAEVGGVATAAGCQLVASCDFAVADETATFGVNGIRVGLFCSTPMVALSRVIPPRLALELLTTGRMMDAREALAAGLVNAVAAPGDLEAATAAFAARLLDQPPAVLALGKRAFSRQLQMTERDAYGFTTNVIVDNLKMEEATGGIAGFLDRKRPAT